MTDYHSLPALGSTDIKHLSIGYKRFLDSKRPDFYRSTTALDFGTAVHIAVLEPHLMAERIAIAPECDRRTKAGRELHEQFVTKSVGKIILSAADWDMACVMAQAARSLDLTDWQEALISGERESEHFGVYTHHDGANIDIKGKVDLLTASTVWDLKTCSSIDDPLSTFERFRYDLQALHYMRLTDRFEAVYVFIEKSPYPQVAVVRASRSVLESSRTARDYEIAINNYICQHNPVRDLEYVPF